MYRQQPPHLALLPRLKELCAVRTAAYSAVRSAVRSAALIRALHRYLAARRADGVEGTRVGTGQAGQGREQGD